MIKQNLKLLTILPKKKNLMTAKKEITILKIKIIQVDLVNLFKLVFLIKEKFYLLKYIIIYLKKVELFIFKKKKEIIIFFINLF